MENENINQQPQGQPVDGNTFLQIKEGVNKTLSTANDIYIKIYQSYVEMVAENKKLKETIGDNVKIIEEKDEAIKRMKNELLGKKSEPDIKE